MKSASGLIMEHEDRYITDKTIAEMFGIAQRTVWNWVKVGKLPKPRKFCRSTRWSLKEVEESLLKEVLTV